MSSYRSKHTHIDSNKTRALLAAALAAGSFAACTADDVDGGTAEGADDIAEALEAENGGLTEEDEAPLFGDEEGFDASALETEREYADPIESDPAVAEAIGASDALIHHAAVYWGQMPPNRDAEVSVDWSGTLSVSRGVVLIRRIVAFEDRTDAVERRTDPRSIAFTSVTKPHVDGFRLTIVDPEPSSAEPLVLTYAPASGAAWSRTIDALVEGPQSLELDEFGNRLVAVAMPEPADVCANGFLRGRWHRVRDGRGRLYGHVSDGEGEVVGHVRGIWGRRDDGQQVFFGKYIDRDGRFRGLFGGTYGDGRFRGHWLDRGDPDRGVLAGEYRENRSVRGIGGHFLGRWAETACDMPLER